MNNLSTIMTALITKLQTSAISPKQVEAYEGQLEDINNFIIMPPSIFVDFPSGGKSEIISRNDGVNVAIYLCTESLHSLPQNTTMLDAINTIQSEITRKTELPGTVINYLGFEKIGNFPGLKIYQVNFRID